MVEFGILDPTKVTRTALQNAASIAGLMITTEAMVAELPTHEEPTAAADGMGGMRGRHFRSKTDPVLAKEKTPPRGGVFFCLRGATRQLPSSPRSSPRAVSFAAGLAASRVAPAARPGMSMAVDLLRTRTVQAGDQSRPASAGRGSAMLRWPP